MGDAEVAAFFAAFFDGVSEGDNLAVAEARSRRASLESELATFDDSVRRELTMTPLLAAMVVAVYCTDDHLPRDLAALYERVVELNCEYAVERLHLMLGPALLLMQATNNNLVRRRRRPCSKRNLWETLSRTMPLNGQSASHSLHPTSQAQIA